MVPLGVRLAALRETFGEATLARPYGLTARELDALALLAAGLTNRQIAEKLFITQNTVRTHVRNIYSKTGSSNRAEAVRLATERGLSGESI